MKQRFRLYRRAGGIYYIHDGDTGKQESLKTRDRAEASALFSAKTQSHRQAHLNLRLARTYLAATDPMVSKRTWQVPMEELAKTKRGTTHERWQRAIKDKAFDLIRDLPILETQAEHFLKVLNVGTVSTNVFLRRAHNFALDMGWLPWPVPLIDELKEQQGQFKGGAQEGDPWIYKLPTTLVFLDNINAPLLDNTAKYPVDVAAAQKPKPGDFS